MSKRQRQALQGAEHAFPSPVGPVSKEQLARWPQMLATDLLVDSDLCRRLAMMLSLAPLMVYSDYTGVGAEIEAFRLLIPALREFGGLNVDDSAVIFSRVCDVRHNQLRLLQAMSAECAHCQGMCVFDDLMDHLVPAAAALANGMVPTHPTRQDMASHLQWLLDNRAWAFDPKHKVDCLHHLKPCFVHPLMEHCQSQMFLGDSGKVRPFVVNVSGVTCDGWTTMGKQGRYGHASEECHNVFVAETKARADQALDDLRIVECTANYPWKEKLREPLRDTHFVVAIKANPFSLGYPVQRDRMFCACLNLQTTRWVGPMEPDDVQANFDAVFAKECAISGDVFFVVPSEERANHDVAMANGQGNYPSPEQVQAFTDQEALDLCLPQYNRSCGEKYGALRDERQSLSGVFLCDLEQNPDERALCGAVWPTLLTKSNIACFTRDDRVQFALPIEHMGAQGMHVVSCPQFGISVSPMRKHIERFSPRVIKEFAGRGMHLGALSAWMLFVLGNTMRIRFEYPCPPLTSMPDDECEDEV